MPASLRALVGRWEALLLLLLLVVIALNALATPGYIGLQNQANLLILGLEKAIVALTMAFVIISGEIDLSVASVMGLCAVIMGVLWMGGMPIEVAAVLAIVAGAALGLFNGFWVAVVGLPSLAVTLATLIGYRGLAYFLVEGEFITGFPDGFKALAQDPLIGSAPASLLLYAVLVVAAIVLLHASGFGRYVYTIGSNAAVARYSGVRLVRVRLAIFALSGIVAALAGVILTARLGAARGGTAEGLELEIITMVLLGGVSIFGGSGTMVGVVLATLLILNLRNGMDLATIGANAQLGVVGLLLILSVLLPNLWARSRHRVLALRGRGRTDAPASTA
jgi:rhamnose transport system permease protein